MINSFNKQALARAAAIALGLAAVTAGQQAIADADISVQATGTGLEATTNVDLCVEVPQILIFGVGAVADDVAKLRWTIDNAAGVAIGDNQSYTGAAAPFTGPAPFTTSATASVVSNGGVGSSATGDTATLPVFLFSNSGSDVTITTTIAGGPLGAGTADALDHDTTAGLSIPISSFTAADGGAITQPALVSTTSAVTAQTLGVVNLSDTWTYQYAPATIPVSGTYEARVTYVAATP